MVVVIGKKPQPIDDVVGSASVLSRLSMERNLVQNLDDLMRYESDVEIERAGTRFGDSGLSIRGIGGNRVAMEVDGIPIADQFGIGSYSFNGRNFIEPELLQQVEILRGPASSFYGSDAIAGVVNFIRMKPNDLLSRVEGNQAMSITTGAFTRDNSYKVSAQTAFAKDSTSVLFSLSRRNGHEMDISAPYDAVDRQNNQTTSSLLQLVQSLSPDDELMISYEQYKRTANTDINSLPGWGRFSATTQLSGNDSAQRSTLGLAYDFHTSDRLLNGGTFRFYHQTSDNQQLTDEQRFSRGINYSYDRDFMFEQTIDGIRFNFYSDAMGDSWIHQFGYGIEWNASRITELRDGLQTNLDNGTSTSNILSEQFPLRDFPISRVEELGVYINDQIDIGGTGLSMIAALRFDDYKLTPEPDEIYREDNPTTDVVNIRENNLSPKLGLEYAYDHHKWYLQYLKGFRAPPFEDANIGLDIPLFNIRAIPNPDLKSEHSTGYELGYRWETTSHRIEWNAFFNRYKDFIQTKVNLGLDPDSGRVLFQSQNLDRAEIFGNEFEYHFLTNSLLTSNDAASFGVSGFWSEGTNKVTDEPLNDIEPARLQFMFDWQSANQDWRFATYFIFANSKNKIAHPPGQTLFAPAGYATLDTYLNYSISPSSTLSFSISNLTDKKYWHWSAVKDLAEDDPLLGVLSAPGRNYAIQFNHFW